jgi:hypothetical protein
MASRKQWRADVKPVEMETTDTGLARDFGINPPFAFSSTLPIVRSPARR